MTCARQDRCKHGDGCFVASDYDVARCTAFKSKVQTNEEWLRSATTEELAKYLQSISVLSLESKDEDLEDWKRWLKEKHE